MAVRIPMGGYGIISRVAMRSDLVSKDAKAVYALICSYTGEAGFCFPSVKSMAEDLGVNERTIKRYIGELVRHRFIEKGKKSAKGRGAWNRLNIYIPLVPEQGDTGDTLLRVQRDTDVTFKGDTGDTLKVTFENNIKDKNAIAFMPQPFKDSKPKNKTALTPSEKELAKPIYEILDKYHIEHSKTLTQKIVRAINKHGLEKIKKATYGRCTFQAARGKDVYFHNFITDDEAIEYHSRDAVASSNTAQSTLPTFGQGEVWYAESR